MTPILFRDVKHHIQGFTGKRELGQDLNLALTDYLQIRNLVQEVGVEWW